VTVDLRACDVEPIHIPGAIQPHGVLIAVDRKSGQILQVSANCAEYFGVQPTHALGRSLSALIGSEAGDTVAAATTVEPLCFEANGARFDALVHRHQGILIAEVERQSVSGSSVDAALRTALVNLQRRNSVRELCSIAVETVRTLTGFDRVMMYRFGDDGHGDVIEESTTTGVTSYRGMRFPASDIPRQARELYLLNWLRLIPDSAYTAVALVKDGETPALDLSFATLRSVSPVHLEYLKNMDVGASMSVSLVSSNALWGLIACHNRTPRQVNFAARAACEVIGRVVALQIAAQEELDARRARDSLRRIESSLFDAMRAAPEDVATALALRGGALLELVGSNGAAVCTDTAIRTVGNTPTVAQLSEIVSWLNKSGGAGVLQTDSLGGLYPPAVKYSHVASSMLAIRLPRRTPSYVLWFRPELVQTVTWAGDPAKPVTAGELDQRLHPRQSFAAWTEIVRGRGEAWRSVEVDAAEDLRRRAVEVDLGNQIERAERAVRLRDEVVAVVSHDLKSPLQVIGMSANLLRQLTAGNAAALNTVTRVERAAGQMNTLIHDLLDLATIESGRFNVNLLPCTTKSLIADSVAMLSPLSEQKGLRLTWTNDSEISVVADAERVLQVFSNLVSNAVKFTPAGGSISIDARTTEGVVRFSVCDTGPGIDATELPHVFDRYWQARRSRSAGSGLGLYIAKGIIEAHGQRIWVESTRGLGATFYFTLRVAGH
jgi:chemotaxis family two-component system sensor kinase Cph1